MKKLEDSCSKSLFKNRNGLEEIADYSIALDCMLHESDSERETVRHVMKAMNRKRKPPNCVMLSYNKFGGFHNLWLYISPLRLLLYIPRKTTFSNHLYFFHLFL